LGVVALGFGGSEGGGERWPGGVGDDAFGVLGDVGAYLLGVAFDGVGWWLVSGEGGQGFCGGLLVGSVQVDEALPGGGDLLVVVA
jgi:hypothetical protein